MRYPFLFTGKPLGLSALVAVALLLAVSLGASAAPSPVRPADRLPGVQTVASDHARFHGYRLLREAEGLRIRGHLLKSAAYPGSLRGRIRVQLLAADGTVLSAFKAPHRHFPLQQRRLRFAIRLPDLPAGVHGIRLIHQV
jgi:hypothetical protein